MTAYPDACPECDPPFDRPACLPDAGGVYRCPAGHRWLTRRDEYGWVIDRDARFAGWPAQRTEAAA